MGHVQTAWRFVNEAFDLKDPRDVRRHALAACGQLVGHDNATFASHTSDFFSAPPAYIASYLSQPHYRLELKRAFSAARASDGAYADAEVFGALKKNSLAFFSEVLRPHHISSQLVAVVHYAGRVTGVIHLNRSQGAFSNEDVARLRPLLRGIGLVHAAVEHTPTPLDAGPSLADALSPREREVALLVARGRTNAEIAEILGKARATVRHQVEAILRKCGVDNRASVAALVQRGLAQASVSLPPSVGSSMMRQVWEDMQGSLS